MADNMVLNFEEVGIPLLFSVHAAQSMRRSFIVKKKLFSLGVLFFGMALLLALTGCSSGNEPGPTPPGGQVPVVPVGPPTSVDDFASSEPAMAENPSRATARAGGTTEIGIPDYLLPAMQSVRAVVSASFAVHSDDTAIAQIVSQNGITCNVRGLTLGSARIIVTVGERSATIIIAVAPSQDFYTLPAAQVVTLGQGTFYNAWWNSDRPDNLPNDYESYTSEPSYQLAWNWRNPTTSYGASGTNCGIDILAYFVDPEVGNRRGWVRTTFGFGGWHYDLNDVTNAMTNGVQVNGDVRLELKPEFVYDKGVPYLQITHTLTNTGNSQLTGQKFGASADVMLFDMDKAPLSYMPYGALMTNEYASYYGTYLPTIKLRLVCQGMQGIDNASTIWMGRYGSERNYVYEDLREDITADMSIDTALNFSYQNIDLSPGQSKNFVMRFTQVQ
jgi:hypothetical protein